MRAANVTLKLNLAAQFHQHTPVGVLFEITTFFLVTTRSKYGHICNRTYELDTRTLPTVIKRVTTGPVGSSEPCQQYYTRLLYNDDQVGNLFFCNTTSGY